MKVIISVGGKFHSFHLAKQLQKRGHLDRLITSYPRFNAIEDGILGEKIISLPAKDILQKLLGYIPYFDKYINLERRLAAIFDRQAARYIGPCDIFVGWSSFCLETLRKAKSLGAVTIVERGSSHIEYQRDILNEEYHKLGLRPCLPDPHIICRELQEYQEADYISIPSNFVKRTFLEKGIVEDKLICIPYGVDTAIFKPITNSMLKKSKSCHSEAEGRRISDEKKILRFAQDDKKGVFQQTAKSDNIFRVVFVGNLSIRKGVHYLLKAVSELKLKNFETWLIGADSSEIKPFLKKYSGSFKYFGKIPYKDLYKYYSYGSVFAIASIEEGLAMVIPQAMACGLPVICTAHSGGEDVVRHGIDGYVVPIRDVEVLKERIIYLYEHSALCNQMGMSALERARTCFTWDIYGDRIAAAYEALATL